MSLAEELRFLVYFPVLRGENVRFSCPSDASYLLALTVDLQKLMQMHDYKEDKENNFTFLHLFFLRCYYNTIDIHFSDIRSLILLKKNFTEKNWFL